jgi:hypothetical protein
MMTGERRYGCGPRKLPPRVIRLGGDGFNSQWSSDGQTIVFIGDNMTALYRKDATGLAPDEHLAQFVNLPSLLKSGTTGL